MAATAAAPDARPLAPRVELFCRGAARGVTLAEAARRAGYAPASARQRGSELWAREDVQARIGELSEEDECGRQALVERMRQRQEVMYEKLFEQGHVTIASRLLMHWWRFEKEVGTLGTPTRAERERLREELYEEVREELRGELREELRGEVRAELVEELREDLAEFREELREELREEIREKLRAGAATGGVTAGGAAPSRGASDRTVTKHVVPAEFDGPKPSGPLAAAAPRGAASVKARLRDQPLPVSAGMLSMAG